MLDTPTPTKKDTAAFKALLQKFADKKVRMNTLYSVLDEDGNDIQYQRRAAQAKYAEESWLLDIIVKARQLGFSTEVAVDITDTCVFRKNYKAGIIDFKLEDAKKKLDKIRHAYFGLPPAIRAVVALVKDNEDELRWSNGSSVVVGTTHRGGTLQYLHISEFGKIAAEKPELALDIIAGALNTLKPGNRIVVESTAHGTAGAFYDMVRRAEAKMKEGKTLSQLDFKLHFFAWWMDPKYRIQSSLVTITQEMKEYFFMLQNKYGITLDADQRAFYAQKHETLGPDKMHEEFPSHMDETFYNSLEGTWFKKEIAKAREERRIGYPIPHDPTYRVNTFWDKGVNKNDRNAILFHQTDGTRHRIIHYYENEGEGIQHYAAYVEQIGRERGFIYDTHYGPHDLEQRQWVDSARPMKDMAEDLGIKFKIVPRIIVKEDAIEAARRMLGLMWIDSEHAARFVEVLENYRKVWNKSLAQWTNEPLHNWASNGADALQTGAVGLKPEAVETADGGRFRGNKKPKGSQWSR